MRWDVVEVRPEAPGVLWVQFADGLSGQVRLSPEDLTGVLMPLRDPEFFRRAYVDRGVVTWPNDIDLAPDAMYAEVLKEAEAARAHS
jgi:hypothetical protein